MADRRAPPAMSFSTYVNGIFCARRQRRKFSQIYSRFTEFETSCSAVISRKKTPDHRQVYGRRYRGPCLSAQGRIEPRSPRGRHHALRTQTRVGGSADIFSCLSQLCQLATVQPLRIVAAQHRNRARQGSQCRVAARAEFHRTVSVARLCRSLDRGGKSPLDAFCHAFSAAHRPADGQRFRRHDFVRLQSAAFAQ